MNKTVMDEVRDMATVMKEASRIEIMPRFGNATREEKIGAGGKESVTAADRGGSKYILQRRCLVRPGSFSEEDMDDKRFLYDEAEEYDPVDGTDEFIAGMLDGFAMHGALVRRAPGENFYRSVGGVIYLPGRDKLWYSDGENVCYEITGKTCDVHSPNRERLRGWVRDLDIKKEAKGCDRYERVVNLVESMTQYYGQIGKRLGLDVDIVPGGGSGASFADLLEGKINIILVGGHNSKDWDIAMAEPIIRARGGFICDFAGKEYTYNRRDVLNRGGYVASIAFKKEDILPHLSLDMVLSERS